MEKRIIWIVMDSVGIGELPDADKYGDIGSDTLGHIYEKNKNFSLPNLEKLGLGNIRNDEIIPKCKTPIGFYGKANESSAGKDTTTGHWEMAGIVLKESFNYYPNGFPKEIIDEFEKVTDCKTMYNKVASGTWLIENYGEEHIKTKKLLLYTSADSVFQIAAHEDIYPIEKLYDICQKARKILDKYKVSRVIARPFIGDNPSNFKRTSNRRDFSMEPPEDTVLDIAEKAGLEVGGIGKIEDIFAKKGITKAIHTKDNMDGMNKTIEYMSEIKKGIIFTNLVDFDSAYGHRRDVEKYGNALKEFDEYLPKIFENMTNEDLLIITADHGCDPTFKGTDHTREYIPILVYKKGLINGKSIGTRKTFADIAATVSEYLEIDKTSYGKSFLAQIK